MPTVEFKTYLSDKQFEKFANFLSWLKKDQEPKIPNERLVEFLNRSLKDQRYQANMSRREAAERAGLQRSDVGKAEGPLGHVKYFREQSLLRNVYYKACGFPELN